MFKVKMKLSQRYDIVEILEEYKKYPCLWRKCDPDFTNRFKRDAAERKLLQCFDFPTAKELKQKIRNIRVTYNQERNKVKNSIATGNGINQIYKPKLCWYELADSFLRLNELDNEANSNLAPKEDNPVLVNNIIELETSSEQQSSEPSTSQSQPTVPEPRTHKNFNNKKIRRGGGVGPQIRKTTSLFGESLDNAVNALKEIASNQNEFTYFANHVAIQLQQLPLPIAIQLKSDIQSLITSVRLKHTGNNSSPVNEQTDPSNPDTLPQYLSVTPDIEHYNVSVKVDVASKETTPPGSIFSNCPTNLN